MTTYFVSIRQYDTIGPTVFADHIDAISAADARRKLEAKFLEPVDYADLPAPDRDFLASCEAKRKAVVASGYIVLARKKR